MSNLRNGDETHLRPGDTVRHGDTWLRVDDMCLVHEEPHEEGQLGRWIAVTSVKVDGQWLPCDIILDGPTGLPITKP